MPAFVFDVQDEHAIFLFDRDQPRADERLAILWLRLRLQVLLKVGPAAGKQRP
jgi:hypothetical protein